MIREAPTSRKGRIVATRDQKVFAGDQTGRGTEIRLAHLKRTDRCHHVAIGHGRFVSKELPLDAPVEAQLFQENHKVCSRLQG